MNRFVLMILRNFWRIPWVYGKLCLYAKKTDNYPEEVKYKHIQYIFKQAIKSGNVNLKIYGQENIPKENGFLLYSNHQGLFDYVAIVSTCDRPIGTVFKKELYKIPVLKQIIQCTFSYPIDRNDIRQSMEVIELVSKEIKNRRNYLIFPEGTRSKKGNEMLDFHAGSFKCAIKTHCPILPIALIDTYKVFDKKGTDHVDAQIHYLKPIYYEEYKGLKSPEIANMVYARIREQMLK